MCDYSLEAFQSRKAEVGDKLVVNRMIHGFMSAADSARVDGLRSRLRTTDLCMTCLADGTVLNLTLETGVSHKNVVFTQRNLAVLHCHHDFVMVNGSLHPVAALRAGTTAEVLSIPGVKPKEPEKSLDEKLGLDKIDASTVTDAEVVRQPSLIERVIARVTA